MGGIGIWSMHFIGIQAQAMPFDAGYEVWLTVLSFLLAVLCSGIALWYVARARFSVLRCVTGGMIAGLGIAAMHYRSEEHTSELQSLMRISYAVFCLKTKKQQHTSHTTT